MRATFQNLWAIIALFALLSIYPSAVHADPSDIAAASRSVVRVALINVKDGKNELVSHGSGVAIAGDKILTNAHVVEELRYDPNLRIGIIPSEGATNYAATIIAFSPKNDLALLQITGGGRIVPANIFVGPVSDGSDVFAIGYPGTVDIAQGLSLADMIRPTPPVKTKGNVSSGRSAKDFATLLHTAPIGGGNSGGPLVDSCGRILGINSFGSLSNGNDAEFFFAIAASEISKFLRQANVRADTSTNICRSAAELTREENERAQTESRKIEAQQHAEKEAQDAKMDEYRRIAEYQILEERDNRAAMTFLLLIVTLGLAGTAFIMFERGKAVIAKLVSGMAILSLIMAGTSYSSRPNFGDIEDLIAKMKSDDEAKAPPKASLTNAGKKSCTIQTERSRITVSKMLDVAFDWNDGGCVNGRTQYSPSEGKWTRSFVPNSENQISIINYDPRSNIYRIERYLMGLAAMNNARKARKQYDVKGCTTDTDALEKIENMNQAVGSILPNRPNELLVYQCTDTHE